MKNIIKNKIKKEIDIAKKSKFSKKRAFIIFIVVSMLIFVLTVLWGGMIHKNTGISPSDY